MGGYSASSYFEWEEEPACLIVPVLYEMRFDMDLKEELFAFIALSLKYLLPSADYENILSGLGN